MKGKHRLVLSMSILIALAGCGEEEKKSRIGSDDPGGEGVKAAVAEVNCDEVEADHHIRIRNRRLSVEQLRVTPGQIVRWTNLDEETHTVTYGKAAGQESEWGFRSGPVEQGRSVCFQFNQFGSQPYFCEAHAGDSEGGEIVIGKP